MKLKDFSFYVKLIDHGTGDESFSNLRPADECLPELEPIFDHFKVKQVRITLEDGSQMMVVKKGTAVHG